MQFRDEPNITINDLFISYSDDGNENDTTVVFVHGFPLNKTMWNNQKNILRDRYRIITYDVRGFGNSEPGTEKLSIDLFASDLKRLLDELNITKVILCGFSMGGYIALQAVEKFPAYFDALILCDTQCGADSPEAKEKRMKSINTIREDGLELYADQVLSGFFVDNPTEKKSKEMIEVRRMIESNSAEVLCNTLRALADRSETCAHLGDITIPVLILVGNEDMITPPAAAEFMQSQIAGSVLQCLEKSAHLSNMDNPVDFNRHVEDFLNLVMQKNL